MKKFLFILLLISSCKKEETILSKIDEAKEHGWPSGRIYYFNTEPITPYCDTCTRHFELMVASQLDRP